MMVPKARARQRFPFAEEIAERNTVYKRPARIACEHLGTFEHVAESRGPARGDHENAKPFRFGILIFLVKLHLPSPAVIRVSRPHGFRAIVDLDEVGEPRRRVWLHREGGVGIEVILSHTQPHTVFPSEVFHRDAGSVSGGEKVHDHLGECLGVGLAPNADRPEMPASRRDRVRSIEQAISERSEGVIRKRALAGSGVRPPTHPAGGAEFLHSLLHPPLRREGIGEGLAQFQKLPDGERRPIQSQKQVAVPRGDKAEGQFVGHSVEVEFTLPPFFHQTLVAPEKKTFINVDELMPQLTVEDVARHYGATLPELHKVGTETRARCFLQCGKSEETGDRALAIQHDHPAKQWHCHQYGCGKGGNLVSLCDLLKPGESAGGRPRGERFKEIARDLLAMTKGEKPAPGAAPTPAAKAAPAQEPRLNVPLKESANERARGLTELDYKFTLDIAQMPPKASSYFRRRPFFTSEVCRKWRMGYLPRDTGEDKSGGTMRGKIVYPYLSEKGDVLTWFGRDPDFEDKKKTWDATGRTEKEPEKFHFVKGFHRGLELFGQDRVREPQARETFSKLGVILVEGPNDVIRLDTLGISAVGLCSNTITREQADKVARLAREAGNGTVTVFLDCDAEGENGMKQCLGYLSQLIPVRLAWTSRMYNGKFKNQQPETISQDHWKEIEGYLKTGTAEGWSLV